MSHRLVPPQPSSIIPAAAPRSPHVATPEWRNASPRPSGSPTLAHAMEADYPGRAPRSSPISLTSVSASLSLPSPLPALHSSLSSHLPNVSSASNTNSHPMSPSMPSSTRRLDLLLREQAFLSSMKSSIPNAWAILDSEIGRLRAHYGEIPRHHHNINAMHHNSLLPSLRPPPTPGKTGVAGILGGGAIPIPSGRDIPGVPRDVSSGGGVSGVTGNSRKRIKLRVPAEKYPEYNFVGRLLGPRGATLKKLERDTGCKIMIRGRGSIRKDKESEVRGKPGWEHVFNENLHVVIEVSDFLDDSDANRILTRAREMVELLLVPVPEERDTLKRQQLRDLAILNGTFRATDATLPPANSNNNGSSNSNSNNSSNNNNNGTSSNRDNNNGSGNPNNNSANLPSLNQVNVSSGIVGYQTSAQGVSALSRNTANNNSNINSTPLVRADLGAPTNNTANFDFTQNNSAFSGADTASSAVLARRRGGMSIDGMSPARARHGGAAAATAATLSTGNKGNSNISNLPSRSYDSGLPDIGSLRIPSLDIETMSENFLVSPVGFTSSHTLPSASPTVVDETYYPFPSTPSVGTYDGGIAFGSPIWSGHHHHNPNNNSNNTTNSLAQPVLSSSPLPSPAPIRNILAAKTANTTTTTTTNTTTASNSTSTGSSNNAAPAEEVLLIGENDNNNNSNNSNNNNPAHTTTSPNNNNNTFVPVPKKNKNKKDDSQLPPQSSSSGTQNNNNIPSVPPAMSLDASIYRK